MGLKKKRIAELHKSRPRREPTTAKSKPGKAKNGKAKNGKAKKFIKNIVKKGHELGWELGTTFVNPPSAVTDRLVGPDSPINAKKLGGRVVSKIPGLGFLVPDKYKPKKKPNEKPKTWRDRMNLRRKPGRTGKPPSK